MIKSFKHRGLKRFYQHGDESRIPPQYRKGVNMTMHNPAHPGEVVRELLEEMELSVVAGARMLHVSRNTLSNLVNLKNGVSAEMALRLEAVFGSTADTWMRMQASYDINKARQSQARITNGLKRFAPT